ncbi:sirohydrochlorin chelatase [Pseudarthrobacter sp. J1763]|uniref:sirohydrochlorin chelatase n=1 Tax=Pseudarthrobacter sp. J1763 TaxID=3420445 RepID=UPI003D266C10
MSQLPILIACSHGTSSGQGAAEVDSLRAAILALRPELDVREAYVDVQTPDLKDVVAGIGEDESAVVVPLLLSVGYHVKVDIARAVSSRPGLFAAEPLGPDPRLARLLATRLAEANLGADDAVVLAAAGSSDAGAAVNVEALAKDLRTLVPNRIVIGYGASASPSVPDAVAQAREDQAREEGADRVVVASYLLAHGFFHDQLAKAGADVVTEPLLPSEVLAEIALERYDEALRNPS